jgi:hypothetical protein
MEDLKTKKAAREFKPPACECCGAKMCYEQQGDIILGRFAHQLVDDWGDGEYTTDYPDSWEGSGAPYHRSCDNLGKRWDVHGGTWIPQHECQYCHHLCDEDGCCFCCLGPPELGLPPGVG